MESLAGSRFEADPDLESRHGAAIAQESTKCAARIYEPVPNLAAERLQRFVEPNRSRSPTKDFFASPVLDSTAIAGDQCPDAAHEVFVWLRNEPVGCQD